MVLSNTLLNYSENDHCFLINFITRLSGSKVGNRDKRSIPSFCIQSGYYIIILQRMFKIILAFSILGRFNYRS